MYKDAKIPIIFNDPILIIIKNLVYRKPNEKNANLSRILNRHFLYSNKAKGKELSFCHKLKFLNPYIFGT